MIGGDNFGITSKNIQLKLTALNKYIDGGKIIKPKWRIILAFPNDFLYCLYVASGEFWNPPRLHCRAGQRKQRRRLYWLDWTQRQALVGRAQTPARLPSSFLRTQIVSWGDLVRRIHWWWEVLMLCELWLEVSLWAKSHLVLSPHSWTLSRQKGGGKRGRERGEREQRGKDEGSTHTQERVQEMQQ